MNARLATRTFDVAPGRVGEACQFDVVRRVVAVTDDAAVVVRRTAMVTSEVESFETDHGPAGPSREPRGRAADSAEPDHGEVVTLHGCTVGARCTLAA